jgi:hypothetical protein
LELGLPVGQGLVELVLVDQVTVDGFVEADFGEWLPVGSTSC